MIKLEDELFGKEIFQEGTALHINALIELDIIKDTIVIIMKFLLGECL